MNIPVNKLPVILTAITALSGCGTAQLSARYSCVDGWGRGIPTAERNADNCIAAVPTHQLVAQLNQQPPGPSGTAPGVRGSPGQVSQVYLPTAGYQITRSGSTVFVNQTSRGR